jgi:hypothetical protein
MFALGHLTTALQLYKPTTLQDTGIPSFKRQLTVWFYAIRPTPLLEFSISVSGVFAPQTFSEYRVLLQVVSDLHIPNPPD